MTQADQLGTLTPSAVRPMDVPDPIVTLCETFRTAGHIAVVVGGRVRDHLLHVPSEGPWDLATSATMRQIREIRPDVTMEDSSHTDLTLALASLKGADIEMTPFRSSHNFEREGRPDWDASAATLEQDLAGRDFTVNAMAYDPLTGALYDPHGGRSDLEQDLLRCLDGAEARFRYDPVRMLRGVRIAGRLGLRIEETTWAAMIAVAQQVLAFPPKRTALEFDRILELPERNPCLQQLLDLGILPRILPSVAACKGIDDPFSPGTDLWTTMLRALMFLDPRWHTGSWAILVGGAALAEQPHPGDLRPLETSIRDVIVEVRDALPVDEIDWRNSVQESMRFLGIVRESVIWPQDTESWTRWSQVARTVHYSVVQSWHPVAVAWSEARR